MKGASLEVADIFRGHGASYRAGHQGQLPAYHLRAMWAIETCRTAELGGHVWECDACGAQQVAYNSCRNRHCPKCGGLAKQRWLEERERELLPVGYFHLVFTLPAELRPLALRNQRLVYDLLFHCAAAALQELAADPKHLGARLGFLALLHTWGQNLIHHPHLHIIVPAGGLALDGSHWVSCRRNFLLPLGPLKRLFRGKLLNGLGRARAGNELSFAGDIAELEPDAAWRALLDRLYRHDWVVYSKPPFAGPRRVLRYLAAYTQRVAISNHRLIDFRNGRVQFRRKDYVRGGREGTVELSAEEFIRRFLLHVLPPRFVRIRFYGLLANRRRAESLALCRELLGVAAPPTPARPRRPRESWQEQLLRRTGVDAGRCPACQSGRLRQLRRLAPERSRCDQPASGRSPP